MKQLLPLPCPPLHVPRLETLGQLLLAVVVILLRKEHVFVAPEHEHAAVRSDLILALLTWFKYEVLLLEIGVGRGSAILRVDQRGSALIPARPAPPRLLVIKGSAFCWEDGDELLRMD